jgi:hypothetical protein
LPSLSIVAAADAGFFDLLRDLVLSIEAQRPPPGRGPDLALGILDLGLEAEQLAWLAPRVTAIVQPGWDLEVPAEVRAAKPHARALTVRPFLPRHFPGYDTYLWIDADVWLQNWQGVELYWHGSRHHDVAATLQVDRAYAFHRRMARLRHTVFQYGYGKQTADELWLENHLNAGVFAARADSPLWDIWAEAFQQGITACAGRVVNDQAALNYAWYRRGLTVHPLPATCNWVVHLARPAWNPRDKVFCEPFLPHRPISMLHLIGAAKTRVYEINGLDGRARAMRLRYPQGEAATVPTDGDVIGRS